jgi:pyruvate, water dikinase
MNGVSDRGPGATLASNGQPGTQNFGAEAVSTVSETPRADSSGVLWVNDLSDDALVRAGAKMARLGALRRHGVVVPDGFVITTDIFERFLSTSSLSERLDNFMDGLRGAADDTERVRAVATEIRTAVAAEPLEATIRDTIVDSYEELCYRRRDLNVPVAVRSSATGEDAADSSFAGLFDTYLGVTGPQRLLESVRNCWASLFTERALSYQLRRGLDYRASPMAVGVLELVHARASGVAFSIHPVTGSSDRIVIEGSWGWGEAVVQGLVQPDHIEVDKADRRILDYQVADKQIVSCFDYSRGAVVEQDMPKRLRYERILGQEEINAIVQAVLSIEDYYGYPVDTEWVLDRHWRPGDAITIVQSRPVTVKPASASTPKWDATAYAAKYAFGGTGARSHGNASMNIAGATSTKVTF